MFKRRFSSACVLAAVATLTFLSPAGAQYQDMKAERVIENVGSVAIDWSEGVVRVTGVGTPPDRGQLMQKRLMAERSATADAYRQLETAIHGIRVNGETLVRDYVGESDTIKTYVTSLIKGAQKMDQRYLDDGTIEIDMVVKLYSPSGLSGALQPQKQQFPPPPVALEADAAPGDYTGLIVDCRGLGLEPAMSPGILSQAGGELYLGQLPVDPDFVISQGIVGYARTLQQARQDKRVGSKPLIVKGLSATGNFRTDVIVSEADTKQLLGLDKHHSLLKQSKVILVL
ncbi:MAG: LPP20 family lipoprotein [Candidatus Sericytochromatia bacterium]